MSVSRIQKLASIISTETAVIDAHIQSKGLAQPSFDAEGPLEPVQESTAEVERARTAAIEASIELRQLLEGPVKALLPESNFAPLTAIYRFKIAKFVPLQGSISFAVLAQKCGLLEHDLKRIVRYAVVHHRVFFESETGFVAHTAASKVLSENAKIGDLMGLTFEECWPAHVRAVDAMSKKSEEANVTGYALANGSTKNTFELLNEQPERAKRFASAMSSTSMASLDALARYFYWESLPEGSLVVDVGGSRGHVSVHLAQRFPHLRFIVQDMPEVVKDAEENLPTDVADRVSFVSHDMFSEQTVQGAQVYLLRYVLHDWPDKDCVRILKQLIPTMKRGARVVIQDHLLPEPGSLGLLKEMQIRSMDAIMLSLFNSREREIADWKELFERADSRFVGFKAKRVKESPSTGVVIASWESEELSQDISSLRAM